MNKNRKSEQKCLTNQPMGTKCVRPVRQSMMYVDLNDTIQIKENSP